MALLEGDGLRVARRVRGEVGGGGFVVPALVLDVGGLVLLVVGGVGSVGTLDCGGHVADVVVAVVVLEGARAGAVEVLLLILRGVQILGRVQWV